MTLAPPNEPCVGIFWRVAGALVVDRSPLSKAEPYGDCLTHPAGHYEVWEAWRRLGAAGLSRRGLPRAVASSEYDQWPRGRVVYESPARRFVLYLDRRLQTPEAVDRLKAAFGLASAEAVVRSDPHYR